MRRFYPLGRRLHLHHDGPGTDFLVVEPVGADAGHGKEECRRLLCRAVPVVAVPLPFSGHAQRRGILLGIDVAHQGPEPVRVLVVVMDVVEEDPHPSMRRSDAEVESGPRMADTLMLDSLNISSARDLPLPAPSDQIRKSGRAGQLSATCENPVTAVSSTASLPLITSHSLYHSTVASNRSPGSSPKGAGPSSSSFSTGSSQLLVYLLGQLLVSLEPALRQRLGCPPQQCHHLYHAHLSSPFGDPDRHYLQLYHTGMKGVKRRPYHPHQNPTLVSIVHRLHRCTDIPRAHATRQIGTGRAEGFHIYLERERDRERERVILT